ncbi:hypothetical protein [Phytohabitans aurantiacus]|jgi:hypothetical protein|uniref:Uncharacterized protein n=1 Tax=Phytohabitans aurantiacus TaxID=3016789 RepID=A0ABQ5QXF5_9ACTN|nr:hypothetical protein [Phytohabitans aurantiacus]GLH99236.1 hypothetical protein Pa4123_45110 [Phytohabitans aurantiacus]
MTASRLGAGTGVRQCDQCGRPLPALDKNEYTPMRARLVAEQGVCMCPHGETDDIEVPERGPSLL